MYPRTSTLSGSSGQRSRLAATAATLFAAVLVAPALLNAAALTGTLDLNSHGSETIAVNGLDIDFAYTGGVTNTFPPEATGPLSGTDDTGMFDVASGSTNSFAAAIGQTVTVHDLNTTSEPTGTPTSLANFITFSGEPWSITLTEVEAGVGTMANCASASLGLDCTPTGSPFNLVNEAGNQVSVSFAFLGTATDGSGNNTNVGGTFSTTFSNTSVAAILAALSAPGGSVVSSAEATIAATPLATTPEPASFSMLLLGSGLILSSVIYRRRQRR